VQRGKHRTPGITPDEDMYFTLEFPKDAPIKETLGNKNLRMGEIEADEEFDF